MSESQNNNNNNNDMERRCEYLFNITEEFVENERPCGEYKIVVNEPVYKAKTETTEVVIDKDHYKGLGFEYKRKKRSKKDSGEIQTVPFPLTIIRWILAGHCCLLLHSSNALER